MKVTQLPICKQNVCGERGDSVSEGWPFIDSQLLEPTMACTSDEIAVLLRSQDGDASERTGQLREALAAISEASGLNLASVLVEKLADGARDREFRHEFCRYFFWRLTCESPCLASWRLPIGDSGLLEYVLSAVPKSPGHALHKQALRLIGNACADCGAGISRIRCRALLLTKNRREPDSSSRGWSPREIHHGHVERPRGGRSSPFCYCRNAESLR